MTADTAPAGELVRYEGVLEEYRPRILMEPEEAKALAAQLQALQRAVLVENTDFGVIPGTDKPSLYKPGAEKLLQWFGFGHVMERAEVERGPDGQWEGISYRCTVTKELTDGRKAVVGQCEGYAGYDEDRYFQTDEQARVKAEDKERYWAGKDNRNPNPAKWQNVKGYRAPRNSVMKMAQKRALVGAALVATSASGLFTQDMEDTVRAESFETTARQALRDLPRAVQDTVKQAARSAGQGDPGSWDAAGWCQALIHAGRVLAGRETGEAARAHGGSPETGEPAADTRQVPASTTATPEDDPWYTGPPQQSPAWLAEAQQRALELFGDVEFKALWAEIAEKLSAGEITKSDADLLANLMKARKADGYRDHNSGDAEIHDAEIVDDWLSVLDGSDPWAEKVAAISDQADVDAALADCQKAINSGSLSRRHGDDVITAIVTRGRAVSGAKAEVAA